MNYLDEVSLCLSGTDLASLVSILLFVVSSELRLKSLLRGITREIVCYDCS